MSSSETHWVPESGLEHEVNTTDSKRASVSACELRRSSETFGRSNTPRGMNGGEGCRPTAAGRYRVLAPDAEGVGNVSLTEADATGGFSRGRRPDR